MVRYTDMDEHMRKDVVEVCNLACEKHTANNEMVSFVVNIVIWLLQHEVKTSKPSTLFWAQFVEK